MIYLDYAANTPVDEEVLDCFVEINKVFMANPNSIHGEGIKANEKLSEVKRRIESYFNKEVIFTSSASESNNLAIKGVALAYREQGKHIITSNLEHSSISGCFSYLQAQGYEVDYVELNSNGTVNLDHMKELLRNDTILVSIAALDGELGIEQPVSEIAKIVKNYSNCVFHTDATQAMAKIKFEHEDIDLITFAPHKFYGLNGSGALLKSSDISLVPLIHGGVSTTSFRSGSPDLANIVALEKALFIAMDQYDTRYEYVNQINQRLRKEFCKYPLVRINSPKEANPYILNVSVKGVKAPVFTEALDRKGICVSVKSACSNMKTMSRPVYAVTKDKKNAMYSWRISLSHLTTTQEIEEFNRVFYELYHSLTTS